MPSSKERSSLLFNFERSYNSPPDSEENDSELIGVRSTGIQIQDAKSQTEKGLPLPRATFLVTNAALGAGMLNFPEAYSKTGGIPQALALQACFMVLVIGAFLILGYLNQFRHTSNYQETIKNFCGPTAQIICQVIVAFYMFGCDVTYLILIGDQLEKVIDHPAWYFQRRFIITIVACLFVFPLCISKKLKVLSYTSLFGSLGAVYVCLTVVTRYYSGRYRIEKSSNCVYSGLSFISQNEMWKGSSPMTAVKWPKQRERESSEAHFGWTHVFGAVPVICLGFHCHVTSVAVFAEMHRPTLKRFGTVTVSAACICGTVYALTGVYGFLTFKHGVDSDILVNYDHNDGVANAARAVIVVVVFTSYALCHFVGRSAFLGLWVKFWKLSTAEVETSQNKRRITTSTVWFFSTLGLSIVVPTIGKAIALVGGFAAHFIFTFPGLCLIQLILQDHMKLTVKKKLLLFIGTVYVTIGVFLFGETVSLAVMEDINGK